MFELVDNQRQSAVIKVIGVGGGGGNAVNHMMRSNIEGVEFICANTDAQASKNVGAQRVLQSGTGVTKGLGAGTNPEIGRQAAMEDRERISEILSGADMVSIATGTGGGTGTGAAPIIAQVAKEMGIRRLRLSLADSLSRGKSACKSPMKAFACSPTVLIR